MFAGRPPMLYWDGGSARRRSASCRSCRGRGASARRPGLRRPRAPSRACPCSSGPRSRTCTVQSLSSHGPTLTTCQPRRGRVEEERQRVVRRRERRALRRRADQSSTPAAELASGRRRPSTRPTSPRRVKPSCAEATANQSCWKPAMFVRQISGHAGRCVVAVFAIAGLPGHVLMPADAELHHVRRLPLLRREHLVQ